MITQSLYMAAFAGAALSSMCMVGSADVVMSPEEQATKLEIHDLAVVDGAIDGSMVNHTDQRLEDIILRVKYDWLWRDEIHPGETSPGWSVAQAMPVVLAPGESCKFHLTTEHPHTAREDGRFMPSVSVVSYTGYARAGAHSNEASVAVKKPL